jgi:PAT family beta-lactamase induction signal transducer AmpG
MSTVSAAESAKILIFLGLLLALASATQDIAIDAYRIQSFKREESASISAAAAAATSGWWTGYAALGFIPLALSDAGWSWPQLYQLLGVLSALLALLSALISPSPIQHELYSNTNLSTPLCRSNAHKNRLLTLMLLPWLIALWAATGIGIPSALQQSPWYVPGIIAFELTLFGFILQQLAALPLQPLLKQNTLSQRLLGNVYSTLILPLRDFFIRNGFALAAALLAFIFLFKIGEAFLGRMSIVFYKEIGFSTTQIAAYSKTLTWAVTLACAIPCGILNAKMGLFKGLVISGLCMAVSNLFFCALAIKGPQEWLYIITVMVDGFTSAWATVAFVAFISHLCDHQFSATQYALLASLGNLGRTLLASNSGVLVDALQGNWALFFALTALMVCPSLVLLWSIRHKLHHLRASSSPNAL